LPKNASNTPDRAILTVRQRNHYKIAVVSLEHFLKPLEVSPLHVIDENDFKEGPCSAAFSSLKGKFANIKIQISNQKRDIASAYGNVFIK